MHGRERGRPVRCKAATTDNDEMVGIMKVVRVLQAAGVGALILAASGAAAQDEGVAVKSLLGAIGIIPKDKPPIEYRERPPLVVPQKLELRPPVDSGSVEARVPNWPRDPDVMARREEEADARRPGGESRVDRRNRNNVTMSSEEIRSVPRTGVGAGAPGSTRAENYSTISPAELSRMDRRKSPELASYQEPERQALPEPPTGYRKPAAGAPVKASVDPVEEDTSTADGFRRWLKRR